MNRSHSTASRLRQQGVTLLELMIVVVVIATLSMIAIPGYRGYQERAQRTEAKSALLRLQANQERFYLQNNTYSNDPAALGFPDSKSENGVYDLAIASPDLLQEYTATATPAPGGGANGVDMSGDDDCQWFSITSDGVRDASGPKCWQ